MICTFIIVFAIFAFVCFVLLVVEVVVVLCGFCFSWLLFWLCCFVFDWFCLFLFRCCLISMVLLFWFSGFGSLWLALTRICMVSLLFSAPVFVLASWLTVLLVWSLLGGFVLCGLLEWLVCVTWVVCGGNAAVCLSCLICLLCCYFVWLIMEYFWLWFVLFDFMLFTLLDCRLIAFCLLSLRVGWLC